MLFGAHMSIAGGYHRAVDRATSAGCQSLQIFTKNANQWRAKPIEQPQAEDFAAARAAAALGPVVAHDSYLINLASPDDELWEKSIAAFAEELRRCEQLDVPYLVTHPGAAKASSREDAMTRVAAALDRIYDAHHYPVVTLLENTAGQGTVLGASFAELAGIRRRSRHAERIAFCFDTCHAFAAGYDVRSRTGFEATLAEFDSLLGLDLLKCLHLNDSKQGLGKHVDRHAHIGQGEIGEEGFAHFVNEPRFADIPGILETPKDETLAEDRENLARLRGLIRPSASEGGPGGEAG